LLYADIEIEIEGLKEQYEESRLGGIERIEINLLKVLSDKMIIYSNIFKFSKFLKNKMY
jgi:hypothetical protein